MSKILLVLALVTAILGVILSLGAFDANPDATDLFAMVFAALAFYFGSLLAPPGVP